MNDGVKLQGRLQAGRVSFAPITARMTLAMEKATKPLAA